MSNPTLKKVGAFTLLPAKEGTCPECATPHDKDMPHNQHSLYYQYAFYGEHGRWPTWDDAMEHCTPEMQVHWKCALADITKKSEAAPK